MSEQPLRYIKRNTNPEIVVSGIVTALAVGLVFVAFKKSGIGALKAVAGAAK
ncbi:hypothetical protein [Alcanivorax sp.]|uniref:hypothetical protein n=1 Tax=Alcanivorax sp. TaxID=1872427 RepID=UPI0025B9353F|nr:hypothetical protein [Alcanivorax sp.]